MRYGYTALLLLYGLFAPCATADTTLSGVRIPDSTAVDNEFLTLNGAGLRSKLFIKVYVGALYTRQVSGDADEVVSMPGSKSMRMHVLYRKISANKVRRAWSDGLRKNLDEAGFAAVEDRLDRFNALFGDLVKGDIVAMNFKPGEGTRVLLNGRDRGLIEGDDFFAALLQVWLGKNPVDPALKKGILGQ